MIYDLSNNDYSDDLAWHSRSHIASHLKCDFSYCSCAAADKISTDIARRAVPLRYQSFLYRTWDIFTDQTGWSGHRVSSTASPVNQIRCIRCPTKQMHCFFLKANVKPRYRVLMNMLSYYVMTVNMYANSSIIQCVGRTLCLLNSWYITTREKEQTIKWQEEMVSK